MRNLHNDSMTISIGRIEKDRMGRLYLRDWACERSLRGYGGEPNSGNNSDMGELRIQAIGDWLEPVYKLPCRIGESVDSGAFSYTLVHGDF